MKSHRIFIAVDLPDELKDVVEKHIRSFFNNSLVRIPEKKNWHITVSFLGYLGDEEIKKLKEIAKSTCSQTKAFEIRPDKIIFAPPNRPKRMVWLDFGSSREFENLKNKIEDNLIVLQKQGLFRGFKKEMRQAHPHLTLARFREEHFANLKKFLPESGVDLKNQAKPFLVGKISIMESFLSREGAKYQEVVELAFGV